MFQHTLARLKPSLDKLAEQIPRHNPNLILLLACDGSALSDDSVQSALKPLFNQGIAYLCTWGPDCERIHDLADQLTLHLLGDDLVMTTWHHREFLKETVWYLVHCAEPANDLVGDKCDQIALAVGNDSWYQQTEDTLQELQCNSSS
jgi:hypothetical protein